MKFITYPTNSSNTGTLFLLFLTGILYFSVSADTSLLHPLSDQDLTFAAGDVDPGFAPVRNGPNGFSNVAALPDGKVLVHETPFRYSRLNSDGSPDGTYPSSTVGPGGCGGGYQGYLRYPDGRVLILGCGFETFNGVDRSGPVRLNADGTLDDTFDAGTGTKNSSTIVPAPIYDAALQADGKILVVGIFNTFDGLPRPGLVRLNEDGKVDTSFVPKSFVPTNSGFGFIRRVVVQPDGKILIAGVFDSYDGVAAAGLARLNADASIDKSCDTRTITMLGGTSLAGLALAENGQIIIAGSFANRLQIVSRLDANCTLDPSFPIPVMDGFPLPILDMVLQSDGRIVVGGTFQTYNGVAAPGIFRLNRDGSRDATFSLGTGLGGKGNVGIYDLDIQPDGKILAAGKFDSVNGIARPGLVRLLSAPDAFSTISGRVTTPGSLGIRNALVTLIDANGVRRTTTTGSFGIFQFSDVEIGQVVTIVVNSKRYRFAPQTIQFTSQIDEVNLVGLE